MEETDVCNPTSAVLSLLRANSVLATHCGFRDDEFDFITNHDIEYRLRQEAEDGDDA
jgi:hypothetical protein